MGRFLNPDNSSFQDVINSEIYVDKTGLLDYTNSVINTTSKFICNSRPRRFGKSITADMMAAYYSMGCDSRELFMGYDISKKDSFEKYLNKYDVLHLDIQWCIEPAKGPENVVSYIIENTVAELKLAFPDVRVEGRVTLSDMLSQINAQTGKRFIVIIDEWDVLIRDEANNQSVQEEYINFLRGLFKGSSATRYIALAYLTGILPIKKLKTQSALNNFEEFTMISPGGFAHYIGFTEDEVKKLCEKSGRDFDLVKKWYDGYLLGEYHIYNPKAVSNVIKWGNFQSYWSQTGTYDSIQPLINKDFDGLKSAIVEMISGAETEVKTTTFQNDMVTFRNKNDVMTLLIHLGYLAYDQKRQMAYIPNEEIRMEFMNAVEDDKWNELIEFETQSERQTVKKNGRDIVLDDRILEKLCVFRLTGHKENTGNALADRIFDQLLFCGYIIIGTGNIQRIIRCFTLDDYAFQKFAEAAVLHVGENRTDIPGSFALQIACLGVGNIV